MPVRIVVARSAYERILAEVVRHAEEGLRRGGQPYEAIAYPLGAMVPAGPPVSPLELVGLEAISALVIADVALPPDSAKAFSPARQTLMPSPSRSVGRPAWLMIRGMSGWASASSTAENFF